MWAIGIVIVYNDKEVFKLYGKNIILKYTKEDGRWLRYVITLNHAALVATLETLYNKHCVISYRNLRHVHGIVRFLASIRQLCRTLAEFAVIELSHAYSRFALDGNHPYALR